MKKENLIIKIVKKSQYVEYKLTEFGKSVIPIIIALQKYS